jgi:glycerol kinase
MSLYLCLDQGGHASRALVVDDTGAVVARAVRDVATQSPAPDRIEQDPRQLIDSLIDAAREVIGAIGTEAAQLRAAGLATQRSSIVCWNRETGAPLSPVISWQDRRAHAWLAAFSGRASEIEARTGLRLSAHYGASKLRWCLDHLASVREAERQRRLAFGPLASFLAFHLLRERPLVVDPSNAQRTLLWNITHRDWDAELLEWFGVPRRCLPACRPTHQDFGYLRIDNAAIPMTAITGDQAAALFAFGTPPADRAMVNIGTGAFVQRTVTTPRRIDGLLTGVAREKAGDVTYTLEGTVNGAGAALTWAAQTLGIQDLAQRLPEWLAREENVPIFLNGVGGLGAPYWSADFQSRFIGDGEPWQKAVAVAESMVFLIAANVERMREAGALRGLVVSGGGARQDGICRRLADVTGLPIWRAHEHEATARGLAWLLAGADAPWTDIGGDAFTPAANTALQDRYARWRVEMRRALS